MNDSPFSSRLRCDCLLLSLAFCLSLLLMPGNWAPCFLLPLIPSYVFSFKVIGLLCPPDFAALIRALRLCRTGGAARRQEGGEVKRERSLAGEHFMWLPYRFLTRSDLTSAFLGLLARLPGSYPAWRERLVSAQGPAGEQEDEVLTALNSLDEKERGLVCRWIGHCVWLLHPYTRQGLLAIAALLVLTDLFFIYEGGLLAFVFLFLLALFGFIRLAQSAVEVA